MKKFTLQELREKENWSRAVIVFKQESFDRTFSLIERSYEINRDSKYFKPGMLSNSLFGSCLDGTDNDVRLDLYMHAMPEDGLGKAWSVDYCYIIE